MHCNLYPRAKIAPLPPPPGSSSTHIPGLIFLPSSRRHQTGECHTAPHPPIPTLPQGNPPPPTTCLGPFSSFQCIYNIFCIHKYICTIHVGIHGGGFFRSVSFEDFSPCQGGGEGGGAESTTLRFFLRSGREVCWLRPIYAADFGGRVRNWCNKSNYRARTRFLRGGWGWGGGGGC
jgi:hypothetical protein